MDKDEVCQVCGGTESKLVDGYYYCVECGTQDAAVRETVVEKADTCFNFSRRTKLTLKRKQDAEMSPEWFKWHTYNFVLAGLTEQLIELGVAPSVRMKVLWIWSRYVKMYQKKDEMSGFKMLSQLEESNGGAGEGVARGEEGEARGEEGEAREEEGEGEPRHGGCGGRQALVAMLALALNHDRSPLQPSGVARLVAWRLLAVNDALRLVPRDVRRRRATTPRLLRGKPAACPDLARAMGRLSAKLQLGPPRVPDAEALLAACLRELQLPAGLAPLARGLVRLLPVPWRPRARATAAPSCPAYDTLVLAYILVALKMCFGLDDDTEIKLSDAVERLNREERRPRAFESDPEPTDRLFSFREWAAHLRRRALLLSDGFGPFAWQRNMRAADDALVEHFEEFTVDASEGEKEAPLLSDTVTMDILGRIPRRRPRVRPLAELRRAAAAPAPAYALSRELAPAALDEDFTRYDLDYAARRLTLPGGEALEGVTDTRKVYRRNIARHMRCAEADRTIVYVKDCGNKNWAKTKRPTAIHVINEIADAGRDLPKPGRESPGPEPEETDKKPETFEEETEGNNIFDDDFINLLIIKEEKVEAPEPWEHFHMDGSIFNDEMKDGSVFDNCYELESALRASADGTDRRDRGVFDSDEESGPQYDPRTFDRAEAIKQIMIAAYKKYIGNRSNIPVRFRTAPRPRNKSAPKRSAENNDHPEARIGKRERLDGKAAIGDVVSAYQMSLARDAMHQVAEEVRRVFDATENQPDPDPPELADPGDSPDAEDGNPDESRDVEVIENADDSVKSDDDSFDEPAYDPVYKGDAKFDEKTHDASQLFLKLKDVSSTPLFPDEADDDASFLDKQVDLDLQEEKKRQQNENTRRKMKWRSRKMKGKIDHLVEDPERITKFNYWFKHYENCRTWNNKVVQVEIDESLPRSFRFVMRECAAAAGVPPGSLYRRVCDVERRMLSLLWRPAPRPRRKPRKAGTAPPTKILRHSKTINKNNAKASNVRRDSISDDASDSAFSDNASAQDEQSDSEDVSKENIVPDEPAARPGRRSGIRERATLDSFWR